MALYFENLDERTRQLMLDEMDYDLANHQLHMPLAAEPRHGAAPGVRAGVLLR